MTSHLERTTRSVSVKENPYSLRETHRMANEGGVLTEMLTS